MGSCRTLAPALALFVVVGIPALGVDSDWDGNTGILPDALVRPYTLTDTADPEEPVLSSGVLTLSTSEDAETMGYILGEDDLDIPDPWVIEFEMRHVAGTAVGVRLPSQIFVTTAPDTGTLFQIGADIFYLTTTGGVQGATSNLDTDDGFHTYRLEVFSNGDVDVYYDDVLTLEDVVYVDAGNNGPTRRIGFGVASIATSGTSEWRTFFHDGLSVLCGDGVVDPPETCDDGNTAVGDGCDNACMIEPVCPVGFLVGCIAAEKASVAVIEKKPGKEKLKVSLKKLQEATTPADFGNPVVGDVTRYDVCLYDSEGMVAGELTVDRAGDLCGSKQKPCFKAKSTKGFSYKDPDAAASGVKKLTLGSGDAGKGKLKLQAGNNAKKQQDRLPTGIATRLQNQPSALLQVLTNDGSCFEAVLGDVKKNDGVQFKAKGGGGIAQ